MQGTTRCLSINFRSAPRATVYTFNSRCPRSVTVYLLPGASLGSRRRRWANEVTYVITELVPPFLPAAFQLGFYTTVAAVRSRPARTTIDCSRRTSLLPLLKYSVQTIHRVLFHNIVVQFVKRASSFSIRPEFLDAKPEKQTSLSAADFLLHALMTS